MTWHLAPLAAFDLETTGVDPETARIITATLVRINGKALDVREWLVNPGVPIPAEATAVHGVTDEQAQTSGIDPATAAAQILAELDECWTGGRPVVIYNAPYDLTVLDRELRRHCSSAVTSWGTVVDPFVIDKELDRYRKGKRTLTATCEHYRCRLEGAHTSAGDAVAAARLAWRLGEVYGDQLADAGRLNDLQAGWRGEWAEQFEEYLASKGTPEKVDGSWPMRPYGVAS